MSNSKQNPTVRGGNIRVIPACKRILVEPIVSKSVDVNGIIIPPKHQDESVEGIVVCLPRTGEPIVDVGDRVMFSRFAGIGIKIGRRMYKLLDPQDLIATIGKLYA